MTFVAVTVVTIVVIVYVQEGERGVKVTYPSKVVSGGRAPRRVKIPDRFLSLRVNSAGMIPLIFAQSILMFPGVIASYLLNVETEWISNVATTVYSVFDGGSPYYWLMYFVMVILFTYFYTDIMFQQQDIGETIQKQGGQVGGRRPGSRTSSDLSSIVRAITLAGAVFLGLVAVLPWLVSLLLGLFGAAGVNYSSRMIISSSGLLIAVGVILDTFRLVAGDLKSRGDQYKKMVKRSGIIRSS
jgi:preprotein translocase subunit SecY